jgi:hypothetical protein
MAESLHAADTVIKFLWLGGPVGRSCTSCTISINVFVSKYYLCLALGGTTMAIRKRVSRDFRGVVIIFQAVAIESKLMM